MNNACKMGWILAVYRVSVLSIVLWSVRFTLQLLFPRGG